jgi:hypothetical protein
MGRELVSAGSGDAIFRNGAQLWLRALFCHTSYLKLI